VHLVVADTSEALTASIALVVETVGTQSVGYSQMSMMFFMIMLVVFLDLTAPASRQANPHCITVKYE
jgi:hypothetical protein